MPDLITWVETEAGPAANVEAEAAIQEVIVRLRTLNVDEFASDDSDVGVTNLEQAQNYLRRLPQA